MRFAKLTQNLSLISAFILIFGCGVFAQDTKPPKRERVAKAENKTGANDSGKPSPPISEATLPVTPAGSETKPETKPEPTPVQTPDTIPVTNNAPPPPATVPAVTPPAAANTPAQDDKKDPRQEAASEEEAAILPYYNNYLREYHLGPEDVISVEVFGQPNYSKAGIAIPPTAKISYPLIPGGVFVGGKTTEQVQDDIRKKLDEYIIDPQVTVTLDKVGSAQFSVLGKVGTPGVRLMNRRYNVYEAVVEAGGIAPGGDKKRVVLIRHSAQGGFTQTVINFDTLLGGKTEIPYLVPGDQIIVPEKKWSLTKIFDIVGKASAFRILFGVPF